MTSTTTLRYWAAARAAAQVELDELPAATLSDALEQARSLRGAELARVLTVCSFLVDGDPVGRREHRTVLLAPGSLVDVLPPFAGG